MEVRCGSTRRVLAAKCIMRTAILAALTMAAGIQASAASALVDLAAPVASWDDGVPLGNGSAGALLWGGGDTLNVTLDRADFWHNVLPLCYRSADFSWETLIDTVAKKDDARRHEIFDKGDSATKLPGVRLVLKLGEGQTLRRFRLDGTTASATVTVATPSGEKDIVAWFDDKDTLLSMRVPDGVTFASKTFVKNASFDKLGGYPGPEVSIDEGKAVYRRFRRKGADNRFDRDFEAGVRFRSGGDAPRSAFWPKFNAQSEVSIPDPEMQRLYDFTIYLYGAGARAGCAPLALQGLWTADNGSLPPWHGDYHNDLNTEMTYWAAGPAGHIEALEAFADFCIERLPECREFCRKIFKGGDGAVIPPTMGYAAQPILGWTAYTVPPIHGIWAFNTFCDAWEYDPTQAKAARYLAFGRELAAGLEHSWKMVDGVRKLTLSCSPEVGNNGNGSFLNANSSYERAILNSFYVWLSRLAEACGNVDEAAKWKAYVGTFGPPNVTKDGALEISMGRPLTFSHRHASHLLQVFPLTNVPLEDGVNFAKSVDGWEKLGTKWWCGYSFSWAGCFEARLGRGDKAYRYLKDFQRAFVTRNGFHVNGDQLKCGLSAYTYRPFTLEGNFGYARGIQEMLLAYDCHSHTYRLFPALPKEWDGMEVSFRNLRLPGGHRVSAKRSADGTITHEIVPNPLAGSVPRLSSLHVLPEALKNWRDQRFGMFIHWGPVSLTGKEIGWSRGSQIPVAEYDSLYKRFNPVKFDADEWVAVAKAAGMKYIVLTTKHHDGFCLWDTKETDYNIMNTPFGRDVVKELSEACRRAGIMFGAYYSTCDWHHPDFPLTSPGGRTAREKHDLDRYTGYLKAQVRELLVNYGPLFCLWHDVPQKFDARRGAGVIEMERAIQPDIIVNNRTGHPGDFDTPEQRIGNFRMCRPWETCMTICRQWAWKPGDAMKSLDTCVHALLRTIGGDGNFLFNVGPQPDGLIEPRQVARLKEMGEWVKRHAAAIYGTRGGPWKPSPLMASTRRGDKIYLSFMRQMSDPAVLHGLPLAVKSARTLDGKPVRISDRDGKLTIHVQDCAWDGVATVVELTVMGDLMSVRPLAGFVNPSFPGATATASTVFGGKPEYAAEMAVDGDKSTRWATPAGTRQAWLRIDLADEMTFSGIRIEESHCGNSSRVRKWELQKLDGEKWTTVFSGTTIGADFETTFNPVTARTVRIEVQDAVEGPTFSEVRLLRPEKTKSGVR